MDPRRFFNACNPARALNVRKPEDRQYYIDFSSVRGNNIIQDLKRTIAYTDHHTCQLFSGHLGCGKSTELLRLQADLEQLGFYVVYFEASQALDTVDVDVTDILMAIAQQVSASLEQSQIHLHPQGFKKLLKDTIDFLNLPVEVEGIEISGVGINASEGGLEFSLPMGIGKLMAKAKDSRNLRTLLRNYLEPRTNTILQAINQELLEPACQILQQRGMQGLVVIIDNLDRVDPRPIQTGRRLQTEYLFVDRGEQLSKLDCHLVYTVPLMLLFSNDVTTLTNRLGGGLPPKVLPMVSVRSRQGGDDPAGMRLLRRMVLVRAFPELADMPDLPPAVLQEKILQIFEQTETLDRLCRISGGHVRILLALLHSCLRREDPPLSERCLDQVIQEFRDRLLMTIDDQEWEMIFQVVQQQTLRGDQESQVLLPNLYVFEYWDQQGCWFSINPILEETPKLQAWRKQTNVAEP
ncbi:MAG: hypothetical protein Kow00121_56700 [Elainellaceae cyanobacterium]